MKQTFDLWENPQGMCEETPKITYYKPNAKKSDAAVVIFPGGGYEKRAAHEGEGYALFLAENGISSFVVDYRVSPHRFPLPLLDARRAVRFVRFYSDKFGIDKNKIAVMGSSAGGHLAATVSTYYDKIDFEGVDKIDEEDFVPDKQILCYPVIKLLGKGVAHLGSGKNLLGDEHAFMGEELSPDNIVSEFTPEAFIWHTFEDSAVNVINSLDYAKALKQKSIKAEVHIFPEGRHGLGLSEQKQDVSEKENIQRKHVSEWPKLLLRWLRYIGYLN